MADAKRGDVVIFSSERVRIESVGEKGMVWIPGHMPIPVADLAPSGEPDTWVYTGNIDARK